MTNLRHSFQILCIVLLSFSVSAGADEARSVPSGSAQHIKQWNEFASACVDAHKQRIAGREVTTKTTTGGYMGRPNFYKETTFTDSKTGRLLSRVLREIDNPEHVHAMELYFYDDQGRVSKDYAVAYLPGVTNVPNQTLINLHGYRGNLHAFRQFDASGKRIYESCEGTLNNQEVDIALEDIEIDDAIRAGTKGIMGTPEYKACFDGIQESVGQYLKPQSK